MQANEVLKYGAIETLVGLYDKQEFTLDETEREGFPKQDISCQPLAAG